MPSLEFDVVVTYDSGEQVKAHIGQRELADWEGQPFGTSSTTAMDVKPMMFVRFIAWSSLRRTERLKQGFQAWSDQVESIEVIDDGDDDEEQGRGLDPTRRAPSDGD